MTKKFLATIAIYLFSLNVISTNKKEVKKDFGTEVYAGRYDVSKDTEYNLFALPVNRKWLTASEWRGEHIKYNDYIVRSRFKTWKEIHIQEFINFIGEATKKEVKFYPKIKPSIVIAQAILESNFGISRLAVEGNNLFGHKYRGQELGYLVAADDNPNDKFTKFKSHWFSLRSHASLLTRVYAPRIKGKPTVKSWIKALCGGSTVEQSKKFRAKGKYIYATSCMNSCYQCKLRNIIKKYNLTKFDK